MQIIPNKLRTVKRQQKQVYTQMVLPLRCIHFKKTFLSNTNRRSTWIVIKTIKKPACLGQEVITKENVSLTSQRSSCRAPSSKREKMVNKKPTIQHSREDMIKIVFDKSYSTRQFTRIQQKKILSAKHNAQQVKAFVHQT